MALETQTDPELVLPPGWNEKEQVMINNFFDNRVPKVAETTCAASECHDFAQSLMHVMPILIVTIQGFHSYTLACPENNQIIQFRLRELDLKFIDEAKEIYADLVSRVTYHNGFKLPVYTMGIVPGVAHCWQEPLRTAFPLERELKTVTDLAKLIAASSYFPHPSADCKEDSKTKSAHATFERLEQNLSLGAIAPDVYTEVTAIAAKLHLLQDLPLVLNHPDLVGLNVFVDRMSGAITGVIDFDGAEIEALGISIFTLYECFIGSMDDRHWSPYDMPAGPAHGRETVCRMLESAFWQTFWAHVSLKVKEENSMEAVSVALRVGVVNRYMGDSNMLDEVDFERRHGDERSLDYVKGILSYLRDSWEVY